MLTTFSIKENRELQKFLKRNKDLKKERRNLWN